MEVMEKSKQYDEFMKEWAKEGKAWYESIREEAPYFYKDGFFDPNGWYESSFRPLFVLKEVNQRNQPAGGNNIIEFVQQDGKNSDPWHCAGGATGVWGRLIAFAYAVLEGEKYREFTQEEIVSNVHHSVLKRIGIINLKKYSGGGSVSSEESLDTGHFLFHCGKFSERLEKQIELLAPTVIICCGKEVSAAMRVLALPECKIVSIHHPSYANRGHEAEVSDNYETVSLELKEHGENRK